MNTTALILLILLIIYVPLWFMVLKNPSALKHGFEKYGPTIKINSSFGLKFIDRFGRYSRFWRYCGAFSMAVSFILMLMMIYIMIIAVSNLPAAFSASGIGIEYALAIPGLNPLLPFWYGLTALIIALVCHEMAHGLQSRANGIGVKHTGLLYAVVPLGAFVEPDQEDVEKASRRAKLHLYAAGITANFVIAVITFLLFSSVLLGGITSPYNDNCAVYQEVVDSPADEAGIPAGAIILEVEGASFSFTSDYYTYSQLPYAWLPGEEVTVKYRTEDIDSATVTLRMGVYANKVVSDSPAASHGMEGKWITSMEYHSETYYFYTAQGFTEFMASTGAKEQITVNMVAKDGTTYSETFTMGSNGKIGYLGVYTTTSGMSIITPDMLLKTAAHPLYGAEGIKGVASHLMSYMAHPFSGFDPVPREVQWWYGDQSDGFWILTTLLFWIFWLNIMLGITNAIPAFPFDGGFIFLGWVDALLEKVGKTGKEAREKQAMEITRNISSLMIFLYILVIIAAVF